MKKRYLLVHLAGDRASLVLHDIPRERASLVGKDVADHAELLVQITRPRHCRGISVRVVHVDVHVDEGRLDETNDLQGHLQRYRDKIVEQDDKRQQVERKVLRLRLCKAFSEKDPYTGRIPEKISTEDRKRYRSIRDTRVQSDWRWSRAH